MIANLHELIQADLGDGDMKIPTFYARESDEIEFWAARIICMCIVGGVFGGIHCIGWFFSFPSSAEGMLWRVSSAVLTGIAFLIPILILLSAFVAFFFGNSIRVLLDTDLCKYFAIAGSIITLLLYIVSRLLLIVEAFISLRHLTPGMLALVRWTSFIPHI